MPTKSHKVDADELYEAIRKSHGVPFEFVTGGVKYRAMLEHKDSRGHQTTSTSTQHLSASSAALGVKRQSPEQSLDELDKYWNSTHDEWK